MKFSLISDMHLDFPQEKTPYELLEEHVVVAGDTTNGLEGLKFLQKLRNKGHTVYAVDGNHEHYSNRSQGRTALETTTRFMEEHPRYHEGLVPVVLANGWYPVEDESLWQNYMNDSLHGSLSAADVNGLAVSDADHIRHWLEKWRSCGQKGIVVTHTAPCLQTLNPRFDGHYSNEWYWNPHMEELLREYPEQILVWCHGHSHHSHEEVVHGVRVVVNPRGYPGENPSWKPKTIEV